MIYADTDFFLALLKSEDWLKDKAVQIYKNYKGQLWTSGWTVVELLLIIERFEIDPERLIADIFSLVSIKDADKEKLSYAAHLMKKYNMSTFDALHAASCGSDKIISSDSIFDKIGLERINLEK